MWTVECRMLAASAILHFALCMSSTACTRRPPARANVLLVTIDTFRADRLGVGLTPALDRLAQRGVRFVNARSAVPLTLPSHATILTGLLPAAHGVRDNGVPLAAAHPTVARLLTDAGYRTAAFVGAFVLDRRFGLSPGFDTYDDRIPRDPHATERLEAERRASAVVDAALWWLNQEPRTRNPAPFFAWIHLYDPHAPYDPPKEFARANPYDGEIAYADAQIARVFDWIDAHGLADRTTIVVAGDHGEGLGDHGERTHGMLLYDSTLRVPLIVSSAARSGAVVDEAVSLADVAPTILAAAGVARPGEMRGRDLLAAMGRAGRTDADIYAETDYPRVAGWSPLAALTDGRWKAIRGGGSTELYDVGRDPQERQDDASRQPATVVAFASRIDAMRASAKAGTSPPVPAEAQERLRALGYVAGAPAAAVGTDAPNPASHIAEWNEFEAALAAANAHEPDALPALARLASRRPDAPVFQTTYARALADAGHKADALAVYRAAARRWPTDASLLHDLAVLARETGRADEALAADRAAIALAPDSPLAHNGAGLIAIDQNRPADAAREFERAAALDPNNATYWSNLGNARRALGDAGGAGQAYRRALDVDPRTADAANGLGVLLVEARRPAEAVPFFERAVGAAPDLVEARLNLGIALQQAGDRARAAAAYREVLKAPSRYAREREAAATLLAAISHDR